MVWPSGKPILYGGPRDVEFYLNEELVLTTDFLGIALVEGMDITYIDLNGDEATYRMGGIGVVLREEREGSPPSGLDTLHIYSTLKVELQPVV